MEDLRRKDPDTHALLSEHIDVEAPRAEVVAQIRALLGAGGSPDA